MRKICSTLLFLLFLPLMCAAQRWEVVDSLGQRYEMRPLHRQKVDFSSPHELRLGVGAWPVGGNQWDDGWYDTAPSEFPSGPAGQLQQALTYKGARITTGAWTLSYTYKCARLLEVGAAFTYTGYYSKLFYVADNRVADHWNENYYTLMAVFRLAWLNRPMVRMYSALSLGPRFDFYRNFGGAKGNEMHLTAQFTYLGISVGRKLFGYAEFGVGAHGLCVAGIGYRFGCNDKK